MKNVAHLDELQAMDMLKAQFIRDCITASLVKDTSNNNNEDSYVINWDTFGSLLNAPEKLISTSNKACSRFAKIAGLTYAIEAVKSIGTMLKPRKFVARLASSNRL